MGYKVLTINPGSTSTKVALFQDQETVFTRNVQHDAKELAKFQQLVDQLPYRHQTILQVLEEEKVDLTDLAAVVGRGGGIFSLEGGTYEIDELILSHSINCINGIVHPANLGPSLANMFTKQYGGRGFVVNPPDTDEFEDIARITGLKGVYRVSRLHALNLKETAIRHAKMLNRSYEDCNFVVCHIGGGLSVSAHRKGRMVDGNDIVGGEGPMAPTRCGSIPVLSMIELLKEKDLVDLKKYCTRTGGFVDHFGTTDAVKVFQMAEAENQHARLVWDGMIYQIAKDIGAMASVLHGEVDGILLGGGMVHNEQLVSKITEYCSYIAPVTAYPGEFEMEAMAFGAIRVLSGEEQIKVYQGKPIWDGFDFD